MPSPGTPNPHPTPLVPSISSVPTDPLDNDKSTLDTIVLMREYAIHYSNSPLVQRAIADALKDVKPTDGVVDHIRKIFYWIKSHVKFVEDERVLRDVLGYKDLDKELLLTPEYILSLSQPIGDCDDFSMLIASMLIGADLHLDVSYVTIAADENDPTRFSHVYVYVSSPRMDGEGLTLDCSHGKYPGWELHPSKIYRKTYWKVI